MKEGMVGDIIEAILSVEGNIRNVRVKDVLAELAFTEMRIIKGGFEQGIDDTLANRRGLEIPNGLHVENRHGDATARIMGMMVKKWFMMKTKRKLGFSTTKELVRIASPVASLMGSHETV
jgi:hypothetical protein